MPTPTIGSNVFLLGLAKAHYFDYRKLKAAKAGNKSAQMIAQINALESKLAVRGNVPFGTPSTNIVSTTNSIKKANVEANNKLASGNLEAFLGGGAIQLKEELELLAGYLLSKSSPSARFAAGPLKKIAKAMSKTSEDYDYAWTLNKDLVRGTIVMKTDQELASLFALMTATCIETYGMFLLKKEQQKSVRDGGAMKGGYSGWNFGIQFKDHHAFSVELQANTFDMMYGKMSKSDYCEHLNVSEGEYSALQGKHKFPGSLGHSLYDIQDPRSKAPPDDVNLARELCLDYNDACRGQFRGTTLRDLNKRIQEFGSKLKSNVAKHLWKHDVDASEWKGYLFFLTALDDTPTGRMPAKK